MSNCAKGEITRKGYTRYRFGKTIRVKPGCIKNRGAPGKWQEMTGYKGIGPLKKGDLTSLGYSHTKTAKQRHESIKKAVSRYGRNSTIRKLNAIAVYSRRTGPSRAKIYKTDVHYVQKNF